MTLNQDLTLTLPARPQSAGLLALADWAELTPGPQLRLTPNNLSRALERGGTLQDLYATLGRHSLPPLTTAQRKRLQDWAQQRPTVTLRPCVLLEAANRDQMLQLWQEPGIRPHLGQQLTAKLATVQTADLHGFAEAVRRRGLTVRSLLPANNHRGATDPLGPGEAFWLAVAFLVHSHLARRLGLTSVPPPPRAPRSQPMPGARRAGRG